MIRETRAEARARTRTRLALTLVLVSTACADRPAASVGGPFGRVLVGEGLVADAAAIRCLGDPDGWGRREELEPHAAVDPTDPERIVAAWMERVRGERGAIVAAVSRSGGRTWEPPRVLPFNECAGGPAGLRATSDPWVSFGPDGRVYVSAIGWTPGEDLDSASVVGVVASADGGGSWDGLARVSESRAPQFMHDNTAIAADPREPGTAWVATTYWGPAGRPVAVSRTADGGRTWSPLAFASVAEWGTPAHGAPQPVITETGVYVFFGDGPAGSRPSFVRRGRSASPPTEPTPDAGGAPGPRAVDAGWSDPVAIHEGMPIEGPVRFPGTDGEIQIAEDILHVATDPETGNLWVVFTSAADDEPSRPAVRISVSADGGTSWGSPIPVGEVGEATWRPSLAVTPGGPAVVTWFRAAAPEAAPGSGAPQASAPFDTEVRLRTFALGPDGAEPGPVVTLDRFLWRARAGGARFLGDYHGLVVSGRTAVAIFARSSPEGARVVAARSPLP